MEKTPYRIFWQRGLLSSLMRWFCNSFLIQVQVLCPKSFKRIANFYCRAAFKNAAVTLRTLFTDWPSFSFSAFLLRSSFSSAWASDADTLWGILVLASSELHAHTQNVPQNTETKIENTKLDRADCGTVPLIVLFWEVQQATSSWPLNVCTYKSSCLNVLKQERVSKHTHSTSFIWMRNPQART